jgi:hypothetical protein
MNSEYEVQNDEIKETLIDKNSDEKNEESIFD